MKDPQITQEKILQASWELLGDTDIETFTMRKLAARLDIKAASIYWHFKNKQSLFDALANQVSREILAAADSTGNWKAQLNQFAHAMRHQLSKYPCSAQLLMETLPIEHDFLRLNNYLLLIMEQIKISDEEKFASATCFMNYVLSFELDHMEQEKVNRKLVDQQLNAEDLFRQSLEHLQEDMPVLKRIYRKNLLSELGSERMFTIGVTILIKGIEQLIKE